MRPAGGRDEGNAMTEATGQTPAVAAAPVRDARAALIAAERGRVGRGATAASIMALVVAGVQAGLGLLRDLGSLGGMFGLPDAAAQILPQALAGAPLVIAVVLVQRLLARGVTRL